jgi:hypothetical protein
MTNNVLLSIRRELHCLEAELSAMQRFALGVSYTIPSDVIMLGDKYLESRIEDVKNVLRNGVDTGLEIYVVYGKGSYEFVSFRSNLKSLVRALMQDTYPGSTFRDASDSVDIVFNEIKCNIKHADQSTSTFSITITSNGTKNIRYVYFKFT